MTALYFNKHALPCKLNMCPLCLLITYINKKNFFFSFYKDLRDFLTRFVCQDKGKHVTKLMLKDSASELRCCTIFPVQFTRH